MLELIDQIQNQGRNVMASIATSKIQPARMLQAYIVSVVFFAVLLATLLVPLSPPVNWPGILLLAALAILTEALGIEIYVKNTSVSTSAAALLGGVLLFGPIAAIVIGPAIAVVATIKYRSPILRFLFNASNHSIGGLICAALVIVSTLVFNEISPYAQLCYAIVAAAIVYVSTTMLIAGAMSIDQQLPLLSIWMERFRWLGLHYIALGIVAYALIYSYLTSGMLGILFMLVPLLMLRYSQKQYVDRTEAIVLQLRTQNSELIQQAAEISLLNDEILLVLAKALDLRDPYVSEHSHHVALYAELIARELGLATEHVELVRRAGLLHDIGKLGIPEAVLYKPARLTDEEYEVIKKHPTVGAELVQGCHSLQSIVPFIRHHHEHYDGKGYPAGLAGTAIPLEARIVGLADAIEAMASDRPYHKAMPLPAIQAEIKRCAGTQFDPAIVDLFSKILDRVGNQLVTNSARNVPARHADASLLPQYASIHRAASVGQENHVVAMNSDWAVSIAKPVSDLVGMAASNLTQVIAGVGD